MLVRLHTHVPYYRAYRASSRSSSPKKEYAFHIFCLLFFLVFPFSFFFVVVFLLFYAKFCLQNKKSWNQHIDFCTFCRRTDTWAWQRERPQRLDTRRRRRRCWRVYLVSCICVSQHRSICVWLYLSVTPCIGISLLLPLPLSVSLYCALSAVRTYLPTVSFRLKGKTVAKMPKTCANARPAHAATQIVYIAIYSYKVCYRLNAAHSANFIINLCFCLYQTKPFCLLSPFAFSFSFPFCFQFIFFCFCFVAHPLLSQTHTHTLSRLYRQIPDKWQFNNEKLKENTKYFFRPSAEKELISLAARGTWNWRAGNGLGK